MTKDVNITYKKDEEHSFFFVLNQRVNDYFVSNKLSKKTNGFGIFKTIFFCACFILLYSFVILAHGNNLQLLICYPLIGFIQICLVLNAGHEGVHDSFSNNKTINHLFAYTFDLLGSSGYLWKMRHIYSHHPNPMVPGKDVDIEQTGMLTFMPMENPPNIFKFQKVYAPILYCFYTLNAILKRDWTDFFSNKIGHKVVKHSKKEAVSFVVSKIIYFTYALVLPLLLSGCTWPTVLFGFFLMHLAASVSAAVALFPAHLYEESIFPSPDNEHGHLNTTWSEHQMSVTMDFGTRLPFVAFFFGGINYHAVHHLFPSVSHVHFPEIRKILDATALDFNIPYNHRPSLNTAVISHWRLLRKNGVAHMNEII
ncbi:fatty acid desaturase family protein [Aurantibacillus circumpalustris]|uniref:fatty acid desaturase family protein n=1 Tax=Aurantibacillus circumpalustris TaxID=3036359 RepID=UPI00295A8CEB|nr:fatty acid desaturase [Aurantibacillus circumpalustris]